MDLEGIMLSEIRQRQITNYFTYMGNIKNKKNKQNRNRLTGTVNKSRVARGEGWGTV